MNELITNSLIISLLIGVSTIIQKLMLKELSKYEVLYIHNFIYFMALNLYFHKDLTTIYSRASNLDYKLYLYFFVFSILCIFLSNLMYYKLLDNHNPGIVSVLVSVNPIWTLAISYIIFNENLTKRQLIGVAFIICGFYSICK